jgi:titin
MRRGPLIPTFRFPSARTAWALALLCAAAPGLAAQTTFTVNSTNDADDGVCDATHCSLREAITSAIHTAGAKVIAFDIAGAGPHTISPTSELPALEDSITVDGTTEPDFAGNPMIELNGSDAGPVGGLNVVGTSVTIRGLVVNRFQGNGISLHSETSDNVVEGCYIGTDVTGTTALGNGNAGVMVGQSSDNTIGGTTPAARNVISGNIEGVTIVDATATGNRVLGNYIGTNATGDSAIPNNVGVLLLAPDNTVGGTTVEARNVISGNTLNGVDLGPPNANNNVIQGNYIGLDATGSQALGNDVGVFVNRVAGNTIGGAEPGARNVVSGNREGVNLWELQATGNRVIGNYVGTDATGVTAIPNDAGVMVFGPGNEVGGSVAGEGNLISGNAGPGVSLNGPNATGNRIRGNYIGTDGTGASALSNSGPGVFLISASDNTIGGTDPGARNILSGNEFGILIATADATGNLILGNYIGTNASGNTAIPNQSGILLWGFDNTIGGTEDGAGNVISGNDFAGIDMGEDTKGTVIRGNYIGTDASGMTAVGNDLGIFVNSARDNTIGGTDGGSGNVISGNTETEVPPSCSSTGPPTT